MLSAFELRRPAVLVIRQSQTQRRHPEAVEDAACLNVTVRLRVPLWEDHDTRAWFVFALSTRIKQPRMHGIILRARSVDRASPGQAITGELPIIYFGKRKEFLAIRHRATRVLAKDCPRFVSIDVIADELSAPVKGTNHTIVLSLSVRNLSRAHPLSEQLQPPLRTKELILKGS